MRPVLINGLVAIVMILYCQHGTFHANSLKDNSKFNVSSSTRWFYVAIRTTHFVNILDFGN